METAGGSFVAATSGLSWVARTALGWAGVLLWPE